MTELSKWLLIGLAILGLALAVPLVGAHGDDALETSDTRSDGAVSHHMGSGQGHAAGGHHTVGAGHHTDGAHAGPVQNPRNAPAAQRNSLHHVHNGTAYAHPHLENGTAYAHPHLENGTAYAHPHLDGYTNATAGGAATGHDAGQWGHGCR